MTTQPLPVYPPLDGTVLLSDLPDFNLQHNPTLPAFVYSSIPNSITQISFLEYARACHRVAHAVRPNRAGPEGEIVALIANTDTILYQALVAGMIRAGVVPFPISPRNSPEAVVSMLQKISCHRVLTTRASLSPLFAGIASLAPTDFPFSIEEIPTLAQCYPYLGRETYDDTFVPYPALQKPRGMDDVILYIHSSGSTGFPKPIPQTNTTVLHWYSLECVTDFRSPTLRTAVMHLPSFHTMGIITQLYIPLASVSSISVYPPTSFTDHTKAPILPTSDNIIEHSKHTRANAAIVVPTFIEIWSSQPESVEWLKTLQFIAFGGGPLSLKVGDTLARTGIDIRPIYGGTEFGGTTTIIGDITEQKARKLEDWSWMRFSNRVKVRWIPQKDGNFECQFLSTKTHQVSVENLSDCKGYATSDIWEPHPTLEGLWRIIGRVDDVLILASGENVVPAPMENIIMSSPLISGALIFGRGRNQVGVLLELRPGVQVDDLVEFRNKIWPIIEEANKTSPTFSRIFKEMILVTKSEKPMLRAAKGTVTRKATLNIYEKEIDALYETVEASRDAANNVEPPKSWSEGDVESWLVSHTADIHSGKKVDVEVDLFEQGFDSLSATFLRNRIIGALRSSSDANAQKAAFGVTQDFVFSFPTIKQLATHIAVLALHGNAVGVAGIASAKDAINKMIDKYSVGLGDLVVSNVQSAAGTVVLLTGSTGGLGSYLLESLLSNPDVRKVYAYNRSSKSSASIFDRQKDAFVDRSLDSTLLSLEKLVFAEGDSALPKLGLQDSLFEEIRTSTTIIIHNAWRLDFNLSLASFEPNIRSTRNLIDLALASPYASTLRFLFTSSITSAQAWDQSKGAFPEDVQTDPGVAVGGGYGEGKYIAERLLAKSGLQASSFRIGQICGGLPNGAWSTTDWVPSFIKSSLKLGALPDAEGFVSWLPMHAVSKAILDVAFSGEQPPIALNIVHPRPVKWSTVMRDVRDVLLAAKVSSEALPLVPFGEWFEQLEGRAKIADEHDISIIPAIKLLSFFRMISSADATVRKSGCSDVEAGGFARFSTEKSQVASPTLNNLQQIDSDDAQRWVGYWSGKGFFE